MRYKAMLLPIHPEHAEDILNGTKWFEYRKVRCRTGTEKIILYATAPVKRVLGEVEILDAIVDTPHRVWELTSDGAGISRQNFDQYFLGHKKAVAYKLGAASRYDTPLELIESGINYTPQSMIYL
ncbi:MAG: hypothetical protein DDT29_00704 [Dehalococcoidia bacterium]|nr:hypothetical protein [Bacillota bacterium]